ncbi:hypothetical protein F511_10242 [Dorcoceras hygrometricum]|uniref:Uncharacterized protein n=1 Tax=Dorcoceras hygrometricum TaxID=472368 RepID=A0A2Z7CY20_9LAMI|nr:hypothetical protein F511_10242 [Dorcoceras hygrometricum]
MDDAGMVRMFKSLETSGLRGFLGVSGLVFEEVLNQLFANASVIVGTVMSKMTNRKMVITMDVFVETFHLPTERLVSLSWLPAKVVADLKVLFSVTDDPFKPSNKNKDMKVKYSLIHDIVVKSLSTKAGSFDVYSVGEASKSGPRGVRGSTSLKALNNKSVLTYMKKNQATPQAGEGRKTSGDKAVVEPKQEKKKKKEISRMKQVAGSLAAPAKSKSETSSDDDKHPLATLGEATTGGAGAKRKLILAPSDSESTVSLPLPELRSKRPKLVKPIPAMEEKVASKYLPIQVRPNSDQAAQQPTIYGSESQQHFSSELAMVKLPLDELVNHLKDISDAKEGEGENSKKRRLL